MNGAKRLQYLRVSLLVIGVAFLPVYLLMEFLPGGFAWQPSQSEYEQMISGVYATLGVFLLIASRDPLRHLSLIWFTAWSSLVHGGIMAVRGIIDPAERLHLLTDVPALLLVAAVLIALTPRATQRPRSAGPLR